MKTNVFDEIKDDVHKFRYNFFLTGTAVGLLHPVEDGLKPTALDTEMMTQLSRQSDQTP